MAKIMKSDDFRFTKKKPEETQTKQFNEYDDILDFLFALKVKPNKTTIWKYFDKWCLSINYK